MEVIYRTLLLAAAVMLLLSAAGMVIFAGTELRQVLLAGAFVTVAAACAGAGAKK
jgi:hypothetical protein